MTEALFRKHAACAAAVAALLAASVAEVSAQQDPAWVLPAGAVRLEIGGAYTSWDARFGASGREPLGAALSRPLTVETFAPLRPLQGQLTRVLQQTAGVPGASSVPVTEETLTLGAPAVAVFQSSIRAPLRVAVGVAPRVELGAHLPLVRGERLVQGFALSGATVGINPDPSGNARVLAALGADAAALGGLRLLPTDSSRLGRELQRRVLARTGRTLSLPNSTNAGALQRLLVEDFGADSLLSRRGQWALGDVELEARVQLLDPFGGRAYPERLEGTAWRAAASLGVRLPTGAAPDSASLFPLLREVGIAGYAGGVQADLFAGSRFWGTGLVRYTALLPAERVARLADPGLPLATTEPPRRVRWDPGDVVEAALYPRYRLTEEIALGASYQLAWLGAGSTSAAQAEEEVATLQEPGGLLQRVGAEIRYTTLPAFAAARTPVPLEVALGWHWSLAGPEAVAAERVVRITASLFLQPLGSGLRRAVAP